MERQPCLHCGIGLERTRGLCIACWRRPHIREQYPSRRGRVRLPPDGVREDATTEQVEAVVAEQMQCLPDWWQADYDRLNLWGGEGRER